MLLAVAVCGCALRPPAMVPRTAPIRAAVTDAEALEREQRRLFDVRKAREEGATKPQATWATRPTRAVLDGLFRAGWQPRLEPDPLPVVELDGRLDPEALARLLRHECCAVVVRGFVDAASCCAMASVLRGETAWCQWRLNGDAASDVEKAGLVSSEALQSFDAFSQYLDTRPGGGGLDAGLDAALREALEQGNGEAGEEGEAEGAQQQRVGLRPAEPPPPSRQHPFDRLQAALDAAHPHGCRRAKLGRWELPAGTFRRMRHSSGLIHADTSPRLSSDAGEFACNVYLSTAPQQGSLHVYPVQQNDPKAHLALAPLEWELQTVHAATSQARIAAALPLRRTIHLSDGDLVLICTGRFHAVEAFDRGDRLSGQCWLSYRRGSPLRLWV